MTRTAMEQEAAEQFARLFREQGYKVSIDGAGSVAEYPWDVVVMKHMAPVYEDIGDFAVALQEAADMLDGHNDGWGCFNRPTLM